VSFATNPRLESLLISVRAWQKYNEGLLKLSDPNRTIGVIIAPGCGHFIQRDDPHFVAEQLEKLLKKVKGTVQG
jgi:pimeloyl-ACP methyl ester carboxylesterase